LKIWPIVGQTLPDWVCEERILKVFLLPTAAGIFTTGNTALTIKTFEDNAKLRTKTEHKHKYSIQRFKHKVNSYYQVRDMLKVGQAATHQLYL